MSKLNEEKLRFMVAGSTSKNVQIYSDYVLDLCPNAIIYTSLDGIDTVFKIDNSPPQVLIIDQDISKINACDITAKLLPHKKYQKLGVMIISDLPEVQPFMDEIVTGQVQFIKDAKDVKHFQTCLRKALNFVSMGAQTGYRLRFLNPEEVLFNEGDKGDCVYIVKKGELVAFKSSQVLGKVIAGEFVGEMSHFNGEPRSASVKAAGHAELIQIPFGSLDAMLFSKPAWSKALVMTLTKRLKKSMPAKSS